MKLQFTAQADAGELSLQVYDAIGADFFGLGITAQQVSDAIDAAGSYDRITCRINSPGGDLFEAMAIGNLLKSKGKPICMIVDGLAASAASILCMSGDQVQMGEGSMMMIHNAMMMAAGNADEMRKCAEVLDTVSASAADVYVAKTGMDKKAVQKMMDNETWMSAQECIDMGFADKIGNGKANAAAVAARFDLKSLYNRVPESLTNASGSGTITVSVAVDTSQFMKIVQNGVWSRMGHTKEVDGEHLTAADFIYAGDPAKTDTWHLPWHFSTEQKTVDHLRNALARFDQTKEIPESARPAAKAKLDGLAKEHGIDVGGDSEPDKSDPNEGREGEVENTADYRIELYKKRLDVLRSK